MLSQEGTISIISLWLLEEADKNTLAFKYNLKITQKYYIKETINALFTDSLRGFIIVGFWRVCGSGK